MMLIGGPIMSEEIREAYRKMLKDADELRSSTDDILLKTTFSGISIEVGDTVSFKGKQIGEVVDIKVQSDCTQSAAQDKQ